MICKTHNTKEIERFLTTCIAYSMQDWCDGEHLDVFCMHLYACRVGVGEIKINRINMFDQNCIIHDDGFGLDIIDPFKLEVLYRTFTGYGEYHYNPHSKTLIFKGRRNSFLKGGDFFQASEEGEWEIIESSSPNRSAFAPALEVQKVERKGDKIIAQILRFQEHISENALKSEVINFVYNNFDEADRAEVLPDWWAKYEIQGNIATFTDPKRPGLVEVNIARGSSV